MRCPRDASQARCSGNSASGRSPSENSASLTPSFSPADAKGDHFVDLQGAGPRFAGIAAKRAVAAVVAAQRRQRQKYLGRERDDATMPAIAKRARSGEEIGQGCLGGAHQRVTVGAIERLSAQRALDHGGERRPIRLLPSGLHAEGIKRAATRLQTAATACARFYASRQPARMARAANVEVDFATRAAGFRDRPSRAATGAGRD